MAIDSRFVYPRSIVRDVAHTIASVRAMVPYDHLISIDLLTRELVDTFSLHDPHTDADDFCTRASYRRASPNNGPEQEPEEYHDE